MSPQLPRRPKSLPTAASSTNTASKARTCLRATAASRFGSTLEVSLFPAGSVTNRPPTEHPCAAEFHTRTLQDAFFSFCNCHCFRSSSCDMTALCFAHSIFSGTLAHSLLFCWIRIFQTFPANTVMEARQAWGKVKCWAFLFQKGPLEPCITHQVAQIKVQ